jgi:hypothetical protein
LPPLPAASVGAVHFQPNAVQDLPLPLFDARASFSVAANAPSQSVALALLRLQPREDEECDFKDQHDVLEQNNTLRRSFGLQIPGKAGNDEDDSKLVARKQTNGFWIYVQDCYSSSSKSPGETSEEARKRVFSAAVESWRETLFAMNVWCSILYFFVCYISSRSPLPSYTNP